MRISFFGKGGSGKTTISATFIKYLLDKNQQVLAIDADINTNLGEMLNIDALPIGDDFDKITNLLEPNDRKNFIGSTPPTSKTNFIQPDFSSPFFKSFTTIKNNLAFLKVGTYDSQSVGSACYHSKLGSLIFIYNRLLDTPDFFVISDPTAGTDSVGTSLFAVSDLNIFLVEPTKKSIGVFKDFLNITKKYDLRTYVIFNKIQTEDDLKFLNSEIPSQYIIGEIKHSNDLRLFEQNDPSGLQRFVQQNMEICDKIYNLAKSTKRDWDKYYQIHQEIYFNDCDEWYSKYYGEDLKQYLEPDFSYLNHLKKD